MYIFLLLMIASLDPLWL